MYGWWKWRSVSQNRKIGSWAQHPGTHSPAPFGLLTASVCTLMAIDHIPNPYNFMVISESHGLKNARASTLEYRPHESVQTCFSHSVATLRWYVLARSLWSALGQSKRAIILACPAKVCSAVLHAYIRYCRSGVSIFIRTFSYPAGDQAKAGCPATKYDSRLVNMLYLIVPDRASPGCVVQT